MNLVLNIFPEYRRIKPEIHVRITDFGVIDQLRSIRQVHLDAMVRVPGVVTRRTGVFPHLKYVRYDCGKCGLILGPFTQTLEQEVRRLSCSGCQSKACYSLFVSVSSFFFALCRKVIFFFLLLLFCFLFRNCFCSGISSRTY